ncbi:hypothetical protein [Halorarum salinum]|uniref:DUF8151 domain-containing protein n=1 Tax=Halorarum salinum TaxID=2743089 RepID=A0A7D5L993_9EURY|nr:hypothetical protein [Halobaculum salinum]QLG60689.1 hypothetical protein HUG12_02590 [Halobaculum salinum]
MLFGPVVAGPDRKARKRPREPQTTRDHLLDAFWSGAEWLVTAAATVGLAGLGVHFERAGELALAAGQVEYAAVDFVLAALALVWGLYLCGYAALLPKTRAYLADRA